MIEPPEHDSMLRDKVRRLMGVFRQLAVARTRPIRSAAGYQRMLLLAEVAEHVPLRMAVEPDEEIVRAERVRCDPEPPCPSIVRPWLERGVGPYAEPALRDSRFEAGGSVWLSDHPEVKAEFGAWMREWRPWAAADRLRRPRADVYCKLVDLQRIAQERPESVELVVASGLLHVPGDGDTGVSVHLITQPVSLEQDPATGAMVCALLPQSAVRLEAEEILGGLPLFDQTAAPVLRERLQETVASPLDSAVGPYLKEWADRALQISCTVNDLATMPSGGGAGLSLTPALVARRRSGFALRECYDAITRSLDAGDPVPLGLAQLVEAIEPADRVAWLERTGGPKASTLADDPLFPLEANEEQAQIINRLAHDSGVVVEGPPGTGKTHSIANLISALLARGQRILVTAEKAQALRVLRDKLPRQMQDLCVSMTDASPRGNSDLARSVAALAGAKTDFNPESAARRIADLEARRAGARSTRTRLLEEIRALRESETYQHPEIAPGYAGTLAQIARRSTELAATDGWVPGRACGAPPLTDADLARLIELLRSATDERRSRRNQDIPPASSLPPETRLVERTQVIARGDAVRAEDRSGLVAALGELPGEVLQALTTACAAVDEATAALRASPTDALWVAQTADTLLSGRALHLWQRATGLLGQVDHAIECDRLAGFVPVTVTSSVDPDAAVTVLERFAAHLSGGGSVRRMFKADEQKAVEAHGDGVLVAGVRVTSAEAATTAARHVRVLAVARMLAAAFAPLDLAIPLDLDRGSLVERLRQVRQACRLIGSVLVARDGLGRPLLGLPASRRPAMTSVVHLESIAGRTKAVAASRRATLARVELNRLAQSVLTAAPAATRPPELTAAAEAISAMDAVAYGRAVAALERADGQHRDQRECDDLEARLGRAAPELRALVVETADDQAWSVRLSRWPQAWSWACARSWIADRTQPGLETRLAAALDAAVRDLMVLTADLAAEKAWKASMERMNARQVQALQSYRSAMSNVGRGTGKYAERFRQAAREAMTVAQEAVPAWVMPVQQVLASIPPSPNTFDVVIIDEASQAELTSSFLLWLAPRVIVVGDDKQCTPSEVAAGSLEPIFQRLEVELPDVPAYLRADLTPRSSIFSMLRSRFGQMVRLREHFRCMPEIINWSSNEFYRDAPLVPVRQFGADRLPPLRTTYVPGAYVEGQNSTLTNRVEARAIADSVMDCVNDPAYEGRTFGVVVLQGTAQVELINGMLGERMSAGDWTARRFRVGTPPDFQGDERHVVWLSMVVAPEQRFIALTRDEFRRRFNVAASRAKDQLWLFHSVTPDRLSPADLRHSLLTYMTSTGTAPLPPQLIGVSADVRQPPFDSLFEQRVFLDITARGYHVTPQVESNGRRIDLVVTGAAGKLAVECDGDAFHTTPEQRIADLRREQELKRCGWTFWRVRESEYYLDRVRALSSLWPTLDRLRIAPHADGADGGKAPWTPTPSPAADADPLAPGGRWTPATAVPVEPAKWQDPDVVFEPAEPAEVEPARRPMGDLSASFMEKAQSGPLSSAQLALEFGITTTEERDVLTGLVVDGMLSRVGQARGTRYVLPGTVVPRAAVPPR